MLVVTSYKLAVGLCVVTMLCWGSWANTLKLARKNWPYQLFYWDFGIGLVIISILSAVILGYVKGLPFTLWDDLHHLSWKAFSFPFLGGVVFNVANILLVAGIDLAGIAIMFPLAIGLALVLGSIINYFKFSAAVCN